MEGSRTITTSPLWNSPRSHHPKPRNDPSPTCIPQRDYASSSRDGTDAMADIPAMRRIAD
jgi:hypothetical protein